eukprot:4766501-Amphidinium_carterae.1
MEQVGRHSCSFIVASRLPVEWLMRRRMDLAACPVSWRPLACAASLGYLASQLKSDSGAAALGEDGCASCVSILAQSARGVASYSKQEHRYPAPDTPTNRFLPNSLLFKLVFFESLS